MKYKMIVRQTMFSFSFRKNGTLKLRSVRFLRESIMKKKGNRLFVGSDGRLECFVSGDTPVARLTGEQFRFVTKAAGFFGYLPGRKNLPIWLWDGDRVSSTEVPRPKPAIQLCSTEACCS